LGTVIRHYTGNLPERSGEPLRVRPRSPRDGGGEAGPVAWGNWYDAANRPNRQGEVISMQDANHTTHAYTRDDLGRVTLDKATVATSMPGFQVDDFVDAIGSEFDALGRLRTSRSYTQHGTGGEAVVNAVQFDYDDLWQVADVAQQPDGDISGGSASVGIAYDIQPVASGNRSRRTVLTYPDGWELETTYGSSGSINDRISRVGTLVEEGTSNGYVDYSYVGVGLPVMAHYRIPNVRLTRFHASNGTTTTGQYPGLDRYGRIARQMWVDGAFAAHGTLGTVPNRPPIVETAYLYDNASSRTGAFDARPDAEVRR